jgi:NADH-quinone oxidoreductase subunit L
MVNAGVYLVARTYPIFAIDATWLATVGIVGIASALLAAPLAVVTLDIKRVLAYSTISQLGLMFAALGLGSNQGWFASQFHLMSQGAFKALGFLAAGSVIHVLETRDMSQMGGLRRQMPFTFVAFAFSTFALAGVPPFIGFWSKDLILAASLERGSFAVFLLILLSSAATVFYSFRALFKVFIAKPSRDLSSHVRESPTLMIIPLVILGGAVLLLFILQSSVANLLEASLETDLTPVVFLSSLAALSLGFIPVYLVYWRRGDQSAEIVAGHTSLRLVRQFLLEGYGFDRFYEAVLVRSAQIAAGKIRSLQTGILGVNLWALLGFLTIVLAVFLL